VDQVLDEEVFFHGHPSWLSMLMFYLKGLLLAVIAGALAGAITAIVAGHVQVGWVIVAVFVLCMIVLTVGLFRRITTTYTITSQRLTIDVGLVSRELHQTRLERVQNVNSRQSLWQRVLGIGTIEFETAGEAGYNFAFHGVARPHQIVQTVDRALRVRHEQGL
jgi:uncharacterized membrane protein YdbT with pleckstrin-like domain